jgi:hypothetical protein
LNQSPSNQSASNQSASRQSPSDPAPLLYGMQLPIQSQSTLYAEPWEADAGPVELVAIARAADRAGFAYVASCDHVAVPRRLAGAMSTIWYDPVATLAYLAGVTERVRLLSHVAVVGLRHPLVTAKQYATLDHLSGGRLILGVGAGHVEEEFDAVGADFARRGAVLDESIDALRAALGADEFPVHHGKLYDFEGLGHRRGIRASGCRSRSPACTGSGRRRGSPRRWSSGPSPSPCTSARRTGTSGGAR